MTDWKPDKLEAAVKAYIEMRELARRGEKYVKDEFYRNLSKEYGEPTIDWQYPMQMISYVYVLLGKKLEEGLNYRPSEIEKHVSTIKELIYKHDPELLNPELAFEARVLKLRKEGVVIEPPGNRSPIKKEIKTTYYVRDAEVKAWLLEEANGVCENCDKPAPFSRADGYPFLEVHHLRRLADGGSDTTKNAIAVCPNCHRELHHGEEKETLLKALYSKIGRLVKE